ncbi:MAG TPA: DNA modification methylase [Candidatus Hydrogenedentes bacterium]|nr:DNA modification methylase [Candidatus Hydrogenedentota bacterium]
MRHFPEQRVKLNGLCPYFTRFPLRFPLERMAKAHTGEWALDPFCGCGTTLFAARLLGVNAVGVDGSRIATIIARAKMQQLTPKAVIDRATHILTSAPMTETPKGPFWELCYAPETLEALCRFRASFTKSLLSPTDNALCALLLGMLHGTNKGETRRFFSNRLPADFAPRPDDAVAVWTRRNLKPPACDVPSMIARRARLLLSEQPKAAGGSVHEADSRYIKLEALGRVFDWVVTSPPYYGMNSYSVDQWLRHWLVGGEAVPQYNTGRQISQQTPDAYVADLGKVWRNLAVACRPGTRLVARIGDVTGADAPPAVELLKASLHNAAVGWKIYTCRAVRNTSPPSPSRPLFAPPAPKPVNETELFARFEP